MPLWEWDRRDISETCPVLSLPHQRDRTLPFGGSLSGVTYNKKSKVLKVDMNLVNLECQEDVKECLTTMIGFLTKCHLSNHSAASHSSS